MARLLDMLNDIVVNDFRKKKWTDLVDHHGIDHRPPHKTKPAAAGGG